MSGGRGAKRDKGQRWTNCPSLFYEHCGKKQTDIVPMIMQGCGFLFVIIGPADKGKMLFECRIKG